MAEDEGDFSKVAALIQMYIYATFFPSWLLQL